MVHRPDDAATTISAIVAVAVIICVCVHYGINHTLVKLGIAAIAGLAGFAARGLVIRP
jgi:hypothetical protein